MGFFRFFVCLTILSLFVISCAMDTGTVATEISFSEEKKKDDDIGNVTISDENNESPEQIGDEEDNDDILDDENRDDENRDDENRDDENRDDENRDDENRDDENRGNSGNTGNNENGDKGKDDGKQDDRGKDDRGKGHRDSDNTGSQPDDNQNNDEYLPIEELFGNEPVFYAVAVGEENYEQNYGGTVNLKYYDLIVDVNNFCTGKFKIEVALKVSGELGRNQTYNIDILDNYGNRIGHLNLKLREPGATIAKGHLTLTEVNQRIVFAWDEIRDTKRNRGRLEVPDIEVTGVEFYAKRSELNR